MSKIKYLYAILILHTTINGFAQQGVQNPVNRTNNARTSVFSDFGPRYVNSATASKFHPGFDYTLGAQQPAYPVLGGTIEHITNSDIVNGYVQVAGWKYMHCFFGRIDDNTWQSQDYNGFPIIIIRDNQGRLTQVFAPEGTPGLPIDYTENNVTVPIQTSAGLNDVIFRARNPSEIPFHRPHLHLQRGDDYLTSVTPFSLLPRVDAGPPQATISLKYNASNVATEFPNSPNGPNIIYGNIIVESEINTETDLDLNSVSVDLIKNGQTSNIFTWNYQGANRITLISNAAGTSATPEYNIRQTRDIDPIRRAVDVGIYPRDGAGLDVFKCKLNSLATSSGTPSANVINKDGEYTFRVTATDISVNNNPPQQQVQEQIRIIDNFSPYIQKVEVKSEGNEVYIGEWEWNAGLAGIQYYPNGNANSDNPLDGVISPAARNKDITIAVTASEPLTYLHILCVAPTGQAQALSLSYPFAGTKADTEGKVWEFTIDNSLINNSGLNDGVHYIQFDGRDLANNPIENFSPAKTIYVDSEIPKRVNATTWNPAPNVLQGFDNLHCFQIGGESGNLSTIIKANHLQVAVNEPVTFSAVILDNVDPGIYTYSWLLRDGENQLINEVGGKTITKSFNAPHIITAEVSVKLSEEEQGYAIARNLVNVGSLLQADIKVNEETVYIGENITFTANVKGGTGNYSYLWIFSGGSSNFSSTSSSATVSYSYAGTKTVTLTVNDGNSSYTTSRIVSITNTPSLKVDFSSSQFENYYIIKPNELTTFYSFVENATGIVNYFWDFGDDTPYWDSSRRSPCPMHTFSEEGIYTITLQVTDDYSTKTVSHTYKVSNLGNLNADFTYNISSQDETTVSFTLTSNETIYALMLFGDGSQSNVTMVSPNYSPVLSNTYHQWGNMNVTLMVWYNESWNIAKVKNVYINSTDETNVEIDFSQNLSNERPWLRARVLGDGLQPFTNAVGIGSEESPCAGDYYFYKYKWMGNIGFPTYDEPCTYAGSLSIYQDEPYTTNAFVEVCDKNNKCITAESNITMYPPMTTNIKELYTACPNSVIILSPEVKGGKPPYSYYWKINNLTISTNPSVEINVGDTPVNYKLVIEDTRTGILGGQHIVNFTVQPSSLSVDAGSPISICGLGEISSMDATVSGGCGEYKYKWTPYQNLSSVTELNPMVGATESGIKRYTLTVTDEFGCSASDRVSVSAYKTIEIELNDTYYIEEDESVTISPTIQNGSGMFSYTWSTGETTKDITVNCQSDVLLTLTVKDLMSDCVQSVTCKVISLSSNITVTNALMRGKNSYTVSLPVTSSPGNVTYTAHADCSWATVTSGASGYTGDFITLEIAENLTNAERYGKLIIESPEALNSPYEVFITQTTDAVRRVPSEYGTIQAAINASQDGDRVEVDEGTYVENIIFSGDKKISVKASGCPENTIITARNYSSINPNVPPSCYYNPVVRFESNSSILQGFTIKGHANQTEGLYNGAGGIQINSCSPELYDLIVSNNFSLSGGGGICISSGSPKLINVKVLNNKGVFGGGIYCMNGNPLFQNVLIAGNDARDSDDFITGMDGVGGGLLVCGNAILDNVTITNNSYYNSTNPFYGELSIENGSVIVRNSIISGIIGSKIGTNSTLNIIYSNINSTIYGPVIVNWIEGNISLNPLFNTNYELAPGSPCINSGEYGKLDKDGSRCDMGYTGGKGFFNNTIQVCSQGTTYGIPNTNTIPPKFIEIGGNCPNPLTYYSGDSDNFVATKQITLKPGFEAKTGSSLTFTIQPYYNEPFLYEDLCVSVKIDTVTIERTNPSIVFPYNEALLGRINLFPNPTSGSFVVELIGNSDKISCIELLNMLGGLIDKRCGENDFGVELDISNEPDGVYMVKLYTEKGNIYSAKVIKLRE